MTLSAAARARIEALAREPGFADNPCFYLYDLAAVDAQLVRLEEALPFADLYYAMKANPNPEILGHMRRRRFVRGVEIASAGELERALAAGFSGAEIIFTGPGKSEAELRRAVAAGVARIHVESVVEAHRLSRIAGAGAPVEILLRLNLAHELEGAHLRAAGGSTKFGIDEEDAAGAVAAIAALPGLRLRGYHVFGGSGVLHHGQLLAFLRHALAVIRRLGGAEIIDLGGGFGIDYTGSGASLDLAALAAGIRALAAEFDLGRTRLLFELGRWLVGEAGFYVTEIVDIKTSRGRKHVITAGGVNHQRRPMQYRQNHPTWIVPMGRPPLMAGQPRVAGELVDVGGPLCTAADVLAASVAVERAEIGDLVVIGCSGAYGCSLGMVGFLSRPPAPEHAFR